MAAFFHTLPPSPPTAPPFNRPQRRRSLPPSPRGSPIPFDGPRVRRLVSIRPIRAIRDIPGTPYRVFTFDYGNVVTACYGLSAGEFVVYFEIDSFIPARFQVNFPRPEYIPVMTEFDGELGYHVKSRMVGDRLSQGMMMPVGKCRMLVDMIRSMALQAGIREAFNRVRDIDLAQLLEIKRWTPGPRGPYGIRQLGPIPPFIPSTDLKSAHDFGLSSLVGYGEEEYQETVKLDGLAATFFFIKTGTVWHSTMAPVDGNSPLMMPNGRFGICTKHRHLEADSPSVAWTAARERSLPGMLNFFIHSIVIQAEICRPRDDSARDLAVGLYVFNMVDLTDGGVVMRVPPRQVEGRCALMGLDHVPVLGYRRMSDIARTTEELVQRADGPDPLSSDPQSKREGIVLRNMRLGWAVKVPSNQYALQNGYWDI